MGRRLALASVIRPGSRPARLALTDAVRAELRLPRPARQFVGLVLQAGKLVLCRGYRAHTGPADGYRASESFPQMRTQLRPERLAW
jgi:hypothetical protein